eukprot:scaffold33776_cov67-Phaeocystis_antarctica.AAC.2
MATTSAATSQPRSAVKWAPRAAPARVSGMSATPAALLIPMPVAQRIAPIASVHRASARSLRRRSASMQTASVTRSDSEWPASATSEAEPASKPAPSLSAARITFMAAPTSVTPSAVVVHQLIATPSGLVAPAGLRTAESSFGTDCTIAALGE